MIRSTLVSIAIVLSLIIIIYSLIKGKKTFLLFLYIFYQTLTFVWLIGDLFEAFSADRRSQWMALQFKYAPICFIGAAVLLFSLFYVEHKIVKVKPLLYALFIPPAVFYGFAFSNERHHLFLTVFERRFVINGPVFWMHTAESYLYILVGMFLLIRHSIKNTKDLKRLILVVLAILIPLTLNVIVVFFKVDPGFDLTPLSFPFSLTLFVIAMFKYKFLI